MTELISIEYGLLIIKGKDKKTNKDVLIKSTLLSDSFRINFLLDLNCFHMINHPGVIKIEKIIYPLANEEKQFFQMQSGRKINHNGFITISEYVANETFVKSTRDYLLSSGLVDIKKMNPTIRSKIIFGIAAIMKYLHKRNIMQINLNFYSIFLDSKLEPRIGSIFLSRYTKDVFELDKFDSASIFNAPEIFNEEYSYYNIQADVFSYSIILYKMFSIDMILDNNTKLSSANDCMIKYLKGIRFKKPPNIPDHYWELIQKCWDQDPKKRPTFSEITSLLRSDDKYALEEFGMKTNIDELHEYQKRIDI